jgi:hypothetical protein
VHESKSRYDVYVSCVGLNDVLQGCARSRGSRGLGRGVVGASDGGVGVLRAERSEVQIV